VGQPQEQAAVVRVLAADLVAREHPAQVLAAPAPRGERLEGKPLGRREQLRGAHARGARRPGRTLLTQQRVHQLEEHVLDQVASSFTSFSSSWSDTLGGASRDHNPGSTALA